METDEVSPAARVLIVDDSSTVRYQVREALRVGPYDVIEAGDGVEAFDVIERNPDLAVIICDMNMPRMDGLQLLSTIRDSKYTVPVIMLTTEGQPALIQRARACGALGWMVKPFDPVLLVKAVAKLAMTGKDGVL